MKSTKKEKAKEYINNKSFIQMTVFVELLLEFLYFLLINSYFCSLIWSTVWIFYEIYSIDIYNGVIFFIVDFVTMFGWILICLFFLFIEYLILLIIGFVSNNWEEVKELFWRYW